MFYFFNQKWGPFSIDRFVDSNNHQLDNFNSRFWTPGSKGVDAFTFDWSKDNNWLVPPICKGTGVIIVPLWRSAVFGCYCGILMATNLIPLLLIKRNFKNLTTFLLLVLTKIAFLLNRLSSVTYWH